MPPEGETAGRRSGNRRVTSGSLSLFPSVPGPLTRFAIAVVGRFFAQGMTVYAAAMAYRGLLALLPFTLLFLALIGLAGIEGSLPRLTAMLLRLRGRRGDDGAIAEVPLEGLLSLGAVVGIWSMATGARLFMRALNAAHGVPETRTPVLRAVAAAIFLPALAAITIAATLVLVITSRILAWLAGWVGFTPILTLLGTWLRIPLALMVIAGAVAAVYRFGPSIRPPLRAVAAGAAVAVTLWAVASLAFGLAISTVIDYGSTYGGMGAAVALLVFLHISAVVLLLGAEVSAVLARPAEAGGTPDAGDFPLQEAPRSSPTPPAQRRKG